MAETQQAPVATVTVSIPVTQEQVENLLSQMVDSKPWWVARVTKPEQNTAEFLSYALTRGPLLVRCLGVGTVEEVNDKDMHALTLERLADGIRLWVASGHAWTPDTFDALDAHTILQYALFGAVVFE